MAETLNISQTTDKDTKYTTLLPQINTLNAVETDTVAVLANTTAALKQTFGFFWVGFYIVKGNELVLGPFQGPIACTRIAKGTGVCGSAWAESSSLLVPDVEAFPGHIACSSDSKSEIVVPVTKLGEVVAVLDVDSNLLNDFDATDQKYLEILCHSLAKKF